MNVRPARHLAELLGVIRDRIAELGVTHETVDDVAGLQSGYASKLLSPIPIRRLSPFVIFLLMDALGLELRVAENADALARVQSRLTRRVKPMLANSRHRDIIIQLGPDLLRKRARKGGEARAASMTKAERKELASKAARARWDKRRADGDE